MHLFILSSDDGALATVCFLPHSNRTDRLIIVSWFIFSSFFPFFQCSKSSQETKDVVYANNNCFITDKFSPKIKLRTRRGCT